jgi:TM2 domain-containing membrane protein YozV
MRKSSLLFLWCVFFIITFVKGNSMNVSRAMTNKDVALQEIKQITVFHPNVEFSDSLKTRVKDTVMYHKKHRLIAALLAFPPLGVFGLHRIYMHTAPMVPFIYIVTAGGLFGVLPFIDFVLILLNKDIHLTYTSNPHLFMWQKR